MTPALDATHDPQRRSWVASAQAEDCDFPVQDLPFGRFHGVDTVVVTGGSASGCVRATDGDSLQRSYRTIVPEECVADKHESPHFANLYDMMLKYADVISVHEALAHLNALPKGAGA